MLWLRNPPSKFVYYGGVSLKPSTERVQASNCLRNLMDCRTSDYKSGNHCKGAQKDKCFYSFDPWSTFWPHANHACLASPWPEFNFRASSWYSKFSIMSSLSPVDQLSVFKKYLLDSKCSMVASYSFDGLHVYYMQYWSGNRKPFILRGKCQRQL